MNAFNCHRNEYSVDKAGCDLMMLTKTTVIELCPLEPRKSFQREFKFKNARMQKVSLPLSMEVKIGSQLVAVIGFNGAMSSGWVQKDPLQRDDYH